MRKFAVAAFSFAAAIFLARYFVPQSHLPYLAAVLAGASFLGLCLKGEKRLLVMLPLLGLAFGMIWDFGYNRIFFAPAENLDGMEKTITATVADYPTETDYGIKVTVRLFEADSPQIKTLLYVFDDIPDLEPGDTVTLTAKLKLATKVFDEETDAFTAKGYFLFATAEGNVMVTERTGFGIRYIPQYIAKAMKEKITEMFPFGTSALFQALLTGDRTLIKADTALLKAFSVTGTYHIIAVSGLHISFFAVFLIPLFGKKRGSALAIPVIWVFAAVTGLMPSVVRAAFMQTLVLAAPWFRREADAVTSLSAALGLILLINPYAAEGAGLQFSFLATLGLILLSGRAFEAMDSRLRERKIYRNKYAKGMMRFVISCFSATLGASIFTVPLTAIYFGYISIIAPLVNLLILWAVTLAFALGITACLFGFIVLPLGRAVAILAAIPAKYMIFTVETLSRGQFASVFTTNAYVVWWLVYVYLLAAAAMILRAKLRQLIIPAALGCIALCAVLMLTSTSVDSRNFEMTVLDVGQGQSIVFTSGSATGLIDCGSSSGEQAGDIAADYVMGLGRKRIDLLILTHFHADHTNGLEALFNRVEVTAIAMPDPEICDENCLAEDIIKLARGHNSAIIYINVDTANKFAGTEIKLFAPLGSDTENELGISILCTAGNFDALITGDIPGSSEKQLVALERLPDIELLVVGHHGSKTSTSQELLDAVKPETAVVSVGHNSYGHPSEEVLERLYDSGITVYRTDECGNVTISSKREAAA
ncbi:MAG: DNA internalization-related competence protein ComEC/Rec2 [Oscillospiraceae bacterium]